MAYSQEYSNYLKGKISKAVGCDTKIKGLLTIWKNIDELFILANSLVCSPLCKCEMTYDLENSFQTHRFAYDLIDTLDPETDYTRVESPRYFSIEYCDKSAQKQIELMFKSNPNNTLRDLKTKYFSNTFIA